MWTPLAILSFFSYDLACCLSLALSSESVFQLGRLENLSGVERGLRVNSFSSPAELPGLFELSELLYKGDLGSSKVLTFNRPAR
jgi:hypothetical protein